MMEKNLPEVMGRVASAGIEKFMGRSRFSGLLNSQKNKEILIRLIELEEKRMMAQYKKDMDAAIKEFAKEKQARERKYKALVAWLESPRGTSGTMDELRDYCEIVDDFLD